MRTAFGKNSRSFFAFLTILSVTFTQACPAFALRGMGADNPAVPAAIQAGLEEPDGGGAAVLDLPPVRSANLAQLTAYFSQSSEWQQVQGRSESEKASVLVGMFMDAIQDQAGTPPEIVLAMTDPAQYLPLALRLLVPGDTGLHQRVDSQWNDLEQQCALCAAHILHENLGETPRRDGAGHAAKDVLASIVTAIDTAKLGRIPTRPVRPARGHGEREVVTQTAYSVSVVGGLTVFQAPSPEEMMRAIADVVPSTPSNEEPVSLPVIHVRALGSPNSAPANHYVAVEAVNFSSNRVHVLDNGEARVMPVAQFIRQYRPTGLLFLSPEQTDLVQSAGFQFQSPTEQQLLGWTGDCGTCAIKGHFPAGYHAPIDWALVSAGRLLYRGADGGTVQVRYRVDGGEPVIRSYRVAYNSTTQELTFRVAEIGQDQKEAVLHQEDFSILEATERFKRKPSEIKRYMAKLLADLAHQAEFRIPVTATILDVVTHFRWATHGPSDIRGTHPHQARPEEVGTPTEPVAKTVTVAHNGIIYDYIELGIQLTAAGHTFESGVDSERFAHLVWEIIQTERPESLLEAVRRAMGRISMNDTYGFQIISNDYPDELVSARNESPIYLGIGETGVDSGAVPFFITAADPKAILPHTGIYSATLLPNRTVVQVKNDAMTVLNPDGLPYVLVMPNGSLTYGHRNDGQMVPAQVFVQQVDKSGNPLEAAPRSVSSLTRDEMKQYNEGKLRLRVSAFDGGQPGPAQAGFIVFQKGVDNPSVYDLGDFPDYTTKELYQSGRGMRDTIAKNTVQVPVYYIPREVSVGAGFVRSYRAANLRTRNNAQDISLTAEQAASIAGPQEWTELVHLPDGRQVFLKRVPSRDVQTPMYDQLDLPEFPRIPSWDQLRDIDEVWGVSVGSSYNSDLDGFEYIRRYSGRGVRMLNSDDLRDDQHWMNDASGKKRIAVIATTQSGTTAVTKANMEKITAASGKPEAFGVEFLTIADTNTPGSDITKPEYTQMEMNEGLPPEIGVLSTAAVHSQKVNKELFGMRLGVERRFLRPEEAHDRIEQLKTISHEVDGVLASSDAERDLREVAEEMVRTNQAIAGYRGLARGAASEMTIKLQEGGEINMITFNMGSFLHGPAQLLQFSKVPVGTEATAEARYDTASAAIVASTVYRNPQGGSELRGFPIIVHYIPEEGDDGARGRLESNFQQVASRGASVYVFTSPEYAADLQGKTTEVPQANGEKKSTSLVRRAFGYPANPYTLTALGQKLALMVAELKNTSMADKLFERARSINEAQVENVPVEFSSREEWVRQRLVDAYAEVVRFRENGWLSQVLFEEGVGSVLSKIDAAARTPGDRFLVDDARDSVARVVSYIDVAQPGKLAKSVTVETGLEEGIQSFEKTQQQVVQFVRGSVSVLRSVDDSRVDSELLDRVRPWLEERGVRPEVRYGDPLGRSVRLQASGPDSRPLFQLTSLDGRPLFLAPAYENQPQQPIQRRVLLVSLRANIRSGHQYWVFPVDEHLQERLGILIGQFVAAGPGAALSERVRQVQGFLSGRVRSAADLPRLLKAYQGLEQEPSGAFFLEDQESDNLVFLVGAFPYRSVPEGAELNIALIDGIRQVEERLSTKLHASRLFVAEFHGEPSVAFFQVAFRRSALQGVAVDLIAEAKQVARPYSAVSPPSEAASARAVGLLPVVPSDFLPEFKVNFERRVGTAVLGQVFGLVEGVFQGGPPQVLVVTDQLDGGSVVWVITGDREGLNRDIGGALAGLGINIDQQVTDTYLPATAPSGQPRVAVSFSSITQPVDVVQSMGVATALESVLGARPVVSEALPSVGEFRRAVVEDLGPLRLPDAGALGTLANQAGLLFEAYAGTGRPQAQAFPYPGDPSRSIVIALDADLSALGLDVFIPIRREAEATVANTDGTKVGGVSFLILVVQDRSAAQIEPAVRRVRRRLEGARMPQAFADYMRDQGFLNRMPNGSLRSIWGKLAGLDDPNEPNEVIPSLNVPDSTSQTAVTFVVRQDAVPGLKERFLALVGEQELQVVPTQEDEPEDMLVETTYQKEGSPESRYLLRAVISASRDSDKVGTILTTIASEFHLHLASGLEETPESSQSQSPLDLVLPDRWPSFDAVVKRLNEALTSSSFLKTVRENLRQTEGVLPGYRPIVKAESDALEKNGVVAENWRNVYVPVDGLSTGDAKRMQGLRLLGTVYLGHLKGDVKLSSGKTVPSEIRNSVLRDVVIGNNVLIRDNILVERYVIGDGAVVTQNRELTAERGTDFGMGKPIPIGPETGGREIKAYPEILLGDVVRLARFQGDKAGQAAYAEALAKYLEAAKADYGYIGRGAEVSAVADGKNLFVADGGVVFDNTIVHNLLLLTAESERSVVVG
ncbi:MAG: DUF4954 family protein, partial [Candidatus Omnitrophota bacterium]|nr:DUF4954 family protein [Candidatus Omnitrophota bacterium]